MNRNTAPEPAALYLLIAAEDDLTMPVVTLVSTARHVGLNLQVVPIEANFTGFRVLLAERRPAVFIIGRTVRFSSETLGALVQAFQLRSVKRQRLRIVSLEDDSAQLVRTMRDDVALIASQPHMAANIVAEMGSAPALPPAPAPAPVIATEVQSAAPTRPPRSRWPGRAGGVASLVVGLGLLAVTPTGFAETAVPEPISASPRTIDAEIALSDGPSLRASFEAEADDSDVLRDDSRIIFADEMIRVPAEKDRVAVERSRPRKRNVVSPVKSRCRAIAESAERDGDWRGVLAALDDGACWGSRRDFLRLRVRALAETQQWWQCALTSAATDDVVVLEYGKRCEARVSSRARASSGGAGVRTP